MEGQMIWDRQSGETYPAYQAFQLYLTERSYPAVAKELNKSVSMIKRWAKRHDWRTRADAYDSELNRKALEKASNDFAAMIERQLKISVMLQAKAANAIQAMDWTSLPAKYLPALLQAIKTGAYLERTARDLKHADPQENLFVSTLEKINRRIECDD